MRTECQFETNTHGTYWDLINSIRFLPIFAQQWLIPDTGKCHSYTHSSTYGRFSQNVRHDPFGRSWSNCWYVMKHYLTAEKTNAWSPMQRKTKAYLFTPFQWTKLALFHWKKQTERNSTIPGWSQFLMNTIPFPLSPPQNKKNTCNEVVPFSKLPNVLNLWKAKLSYMFMFTVTHATVPWSH